ncbi:MAG: hypothetical protein M8861_11075 [marine benthic group bacterium]|nr:hypothetical protein [Gemmatimonadota bacterium]
MSAVVALPAAPNVEKGQYSMLTSDLRKTVSVTITALFMMVSTACGQMAVTTDEDATRAADLITQENLRLQLGIIAHDSMRGRDTPRPELNQTARYIAGQFRSSGSNPARGTATSRRTR